MVSRRMNRSLPLFPLSGNAGKTGNLPSTLSINSTRPSAKSGRQQKTKLTKTNHETKITHIQHRTRTVSHAGRKPGLYLTARNRADAERTGDGCGIVPRGVQPERLRLPLK